MTSIHFRHAAPQAPDGSPYPFHFLSTTESFRFPVSLSSSHSCRPSTVLRCGIPPFEFPPCCCQSIPSSACSAPTSFLAAGPCFGLASWLFGCAAQMCLGSLSLLPSSNHLQSSYYLEGTTQLWASPPLSQHTNYTKRHRNASHGGCGLRSTLSRVPGAGLERPGRFATRFVPSSPAPPQIAGR